MDNQSEERFDETLEELQERIGKIKQVFPLLGDEEARSLALTVGMASNLRPALASASLGLPTLGSFGPIPVEVTRADRLEVSGTLEIIASMILVAGVNVEDILRRLDGTHVSLSIVYTRPKEE